jgi:Xaa-Pro aminopeptidase
VDEHLTARRAAQEGFVEPSFPTIAGAGPNGAIIHYRAKAATAGWVMMRMSHHKFGFSLDLIWSTVP